MRKYFLLLLSHAVVAFLGFAAGIYVLPILTAPPAPRDAEVQAVAEAARFTGQFRRELKDSDALHWGEGQLSVGADAISLKGKLAPGPDYRLYLSPEFVETKADFLRLQSRMQQVGEIRTFENFVVKLPAGVDPAHYNTAIVWCESFKAFITAAQYRP